MRSVVTSQEGFWLLGVSFAEDIQKLSKGPVGFVSLFNRRILPGLCMNRSSQLRAEY